MRVSLYKHELDAVTSLTITLTNMARGEQDGYVADIGPAIFGKLLDAMYARGNYKHDLYCNTPSQISEDLSEVP